ncbi:MAG: NAD-dependent epimerase/dehydratase family protein, partial [Planctomycetes bacterium]|nr:NAD-dependent epimerase/dehydratase family protein [Planctomycetota bacterium]
PAQAIPTNEDCPLHPTSIYAITKRDQEEMCLTIGRAYGIPTVVLRYFNIYGPRQALSNPYAGVAAIFSARLLSGQPPVIYEDGLQSRDFIHVSDIVQANLLAMKSHRADYHALNVGTGVATSVRRVAELLIRQLGSDQAPELPGKFRPGDTRHCFADLTRIRQTLGFQPKVKFEDGIDELVEWVKEQSAVVSKRKLTSAFDKMKREMAKKKMAR